MSQVEASNQVFKPASLEERLISKWLGEGIYPNDSELHQLRQRTAGQILGDLAVSDSGPTELDTGRFNDVFEQHRPSITNYKCAAALCSYLEAGDWRKEDEIHYPHQNEAMQAVLQGLLSGEPLGHIITPTGGGKAYMIAKLTEAFTGAGLRVLVAAHRKTITQQLGNNPSKGIKRFAHDLNPSDIALHYGQYKASHQAPVVVSTFQSMNKFARTGELGDFDVILADEVHNALGEVTKANLINFSPPAVKIGLTATPDYAIDKRVSNILPHKYFEYNVRNAIEDGVISPVQVLVYVTGAEIPSLDKNYSDFTDRELAKLIELKSRNAAAVQIVQNLVESGRQGYAACVSGEDRAHARMMARLISAEEIIDSKTGQRRKIIARSVTGDMSDDEREQVLKNYEQGLIDVLSFVDVLTEGWDSDKSSFGIDLRPTTSIVKKTQTVGRGLRKKANEFIFVEFRDSSAKNQVSALQVFGEQVFSLGKVVSPAGYEWEPRARRSYLRGIFSENLWDSFSTFDSKLIKDLVIRHKDAEFDRLYQEWNSKLIADGMPEESPDYMGLSLSFVKAIAKIKRLPGTKTTYVHEREHYLSSKTRPVFSWERGRQYVEKEEPDLSERDAIELEYLRSVIKAGHESKYSDVKIPELVEPVDPHDLNQRIEQANPNIDTTLVNAAYEITRQSLIRVINTLSPQQKSLIENRVFTPYHKTLDDVGRELGVTRERARQIEIEALGKIVWAISRGDTTDGLLADEIQLEKQHIFKESSQPERISKEVLMQSVSGASRLARQRVDKWRQMAAASKTETDKQQAEAKLARDEALVILYEQYLRKLFKGPATTANTINFNAAMFKEYIDAHFADPHEAADNYKDLYEWIRNSLNGYVEIHGAIVTPFQNQASFNNWLNRLVTTAVTFVSNRQWHMPPTPSL